MKKVYVAGPMTGIAYFNYPAFKEARELLTQLGFQVVCPAKDLEDRFPAFESRKCYTGSPGEVKKLLPNFDYRAQMLHCIDLVSQCDYIYLLEGAFNSKGAKAEYTFARAVGIPVLNISLS